jgi:hypothetical protein
MFWGVQLLSFLRWPVGYLINLLATVMSLAQDWLPAPLLLLADYPIVWAAETFCLRDGVQDDWCPLVPNWAVELNKIAVTKLYGKRPMDRVNEYLARNKPADCH